MRSGALPLPGDHRALALPALPDHRHATEIIQDHPPMTTSILEQPPIESIPIKIAPGTEPDEPSTLRAHDMRALGLAAAARSLGSGSRTLGPSRSGEHRLTSCTARSALVTRFAHRSRSPWPQPPEPDSTPPFRPAISPRHRSGSDWDARTPTARAPNSANELGWFVVRDDREPVVSRPDEDRAGSVATTGSQMMARRARTPRR